MASVNTQQKQQCRSLSIISYNMHGFNQGFSTVRDLSASSTPDIFLLQEHWLTPANLNKFDIFSNYFAFGTSAMSSAVESGILYGRPFGGVMALINNNLRPYTQSVFSNDRCTIIKLFNYVIINVYLPCSGSPDRLLILDNLLSEISIQLDNFSDCVFLLGGDFNCNVDHNDPASRIVNSFIMENKLVRCDECVGPKAEYTYSNESLNCRSCIDFFFVSDSDRNCIDKFKVIDEGSNLSDHLPINVICVYDDVNIKSAPAKAKDSLQEYLRWDHADLLAYYSLTGTHLQALLAELNCLDESIIESVIPAVNSIYDRTVDILRNCANITVPIRKRSFYKFWWNEELDCLKQQSIDDHRLWKSMGKPRCGQVFDKCRASKLLYKQRIREFQRNESTSYTNDLHESLLAKDGSSFWSVWRSKFDIKKSRASQVDGLVDDDDIVNKFVDYFVNASSNLTDEGSKKLKENYYSRRPAYCGSPNLDNYNIDAELVDIVVHHLKRGKAAGLDGITVEHILHCHPVIYTLLSKLFNLLLKYGFVPNEFGRSYTVPLPKCIVINKVLSTDDFRGISISPVVSKIFENCILNRYGSFLGTSDCQFGFKKEIGCSHAIYSLRCVIDSYINSGSTVNLCALDLKKAFDKVNHHGLYLKLMDRQIPNGLLSVLEYWYDMCTTCVKWGNVYSCFFKLNCGVRQGGVLSPYLFACYIDDIVALLQSSGLGCYFKGTPICVILYADDIMLISPSVTGLQEMLVICERHLSFLELALNPKKSVCIRFGPRFDKACSLLSTASGQQLAWVETCRYLGVFLQSSRYFKCCYRNAKKAYFRSFNSVFGKIGNIASEEVVVKLIMMKCIPVILYGLDACPVNATDRHSLDFVLTRCLMKLFKTGSNIVIEECMDAFGVKRLSEVVIRRKMLFLHRYCDSTNIICKSFCDIARTELLYIGRQ